jgi:hypothetical protein
MAQAMLYIGVCRKKSYFYKLFNLLCCILSAHSPCLFLKIKSTSSHFFFFNKPNIYDPLF